MVNSRSDLQLRLVRQLLKMIVDGNLAPGAHLREVELARTFGVSRTPLRAALSQILILGAAEKGDGRGLRVVADPVRAARLLESAPQEDDETVKVQITRDWFEGRVPREVSESFFRARYGLGKVALARVLSILANEGIISRMPGYGWQFEPTLNSQIANDASYDFRMLVEPGSILLPSFVYHTDRAISIRRQHERVLHSRSRDIRELFQLDEDFHLFIADCSRNTFVVQAVTQQNKLRRLLEYESLIDSGRMNASCREHLAILDALDAGKREVAAASMRRHLRKAKAAPPEFRS